MKIFLTVLLMTGYWFTAAAQPLLRNPATTNAAPPFQHWSTNLTNWAQLPTNVLSSMGTGSVVSVGMTVPSGFGVSAGPVTGSGNVGFTNTHQGTYKIWQTTALGGAPTWDDMTTGHLPDGIPATKIANGAVIDGEFEKLSGLGVGTIAAQLAAKLDATNGLANGLANVGTLTNTGRADFAGHVTVYNFQTNKTSVYVAGALDVTGDLVPRAQINISSAGTNVRLVKQGDGVLRFSDGANTDFNRLQLGGTTTNFPAIAKLSGAAATNVIRLGDATLGASGVMLEFMQTPFSSSNPSTDSARIYAKDNAGTAALYVKDEAGTESIISPHAMDSPGLDSDTNALPIIIRHRNEYLGTEEWIHLSALAKAVELLLPGQKFVYSRDLPQNERRDWDQDQAAKQAFYDQERARELAEFEAGNTNIVVRPVKDIRKPKPVLLNRKKAK